MNTLNNKQLKEMIENTKGRIFVANFIKATGEQRKMVCRLGVRKSLTGTGRSYTKENLVTVYDMVNHAYRNINLNTLIDFKCGKVEWKGGSK